MHAFSVARLYPTLRDPMEPAKLLCPWDFSGKNTGAGLPFPSPGDLPNPRIEPTSPALTGRFFTTEPPGNPKQVERGLKYGLAGSMKLEPWKSYHVVIFFFFDTWESCKLSSLLTQGLSGGPASDSIRQGGCCWLSPVPIVLCPLSIAITFHHSWRGPSPSMGVDSLWQPV